MGRLVFLAFIVALLPSACGDRTPTGESAALPSPAAPVSLQATAPLSSATATFDCSQLEEVRVRFSDPGFLDHLRVGLYVQYVGVPSGQKKLRIWWDYENAFDRFQDIRIDDSDLERLSGREVYGNVTEHQYEPVSASTPRKVRAELYVAGASAGALATATSSSVPRVRREADADRPCGRRSLQGVQTSTRHEGNLGGIAGADAICGARAGEAQLSGTFLAWLSDDESSPSTRFVHAPFPYVLLDGTVVAANWESLTGQRLEHHIDVTELGVEAVGLGTVWTRTLPNGTAASFGLGPDCGGWRRSDPNAFGTNGQHQGNLALWSFIGASSCNARLRLYCFEQ
jgi:hypothetical protein